MKTFVTKKKDIERKWYLIDAKNVILGKVAVKAADVLRGKNKAIFSPAVDAGDFVIIVNADKVKVTGGKEEKKKYYNYSGYPGGMRELSFNEMMDRDSRKVLTLAIKGMLPKNKLATEIIKKLKIYKNEEHNHEAQQPEEIEIS